MKAFNQRMLDSAGEKHSRVVLALDFWEPYDSRLRRARGVLEQTKNRIAAVKVNHHLLLPYGLEGLRSLIATCRGEGLPLIADLKINDIESTNLNAVESLFAYGFDSLIANPFVGREEGLGGVVERVHELKGGILFLVYMSHGGSREGYGLRIEGGAPLYTVFAERAMAWGADGVIVSAKSPDKIKETRKIIGKERLIFSPGVGAQGGGARASVSAGTDFLIVGRSVTESSDPGRVVDDLNAG